MRYLKGFGLTKLNKKYSFVYKIIPEGMMARDFLFKTLVVFLAAAALVALSACGDDVTEVTEVTQVVGMQVVEAGDAMPKCTAENEGAIVYSVDSAVSYACINREWIPMKGKDGAEGKEGKSGTNGTNGKNGSNGTSCKAVQITDGYKIVCGEDSVGVVLNGQDGATIINNKSCTVKAIAPESLHPNGGYKITCDTINFELFNGNDGNDGEDGAPAFIDKSIYDAQSNTLIDLRDGKSYRTTTVGDQVWMAENLDYVYYFATNEDIFAVPGFCYNGVSANCVKYGRLYYWSAAMDSAGVFSTGGKGCGNEITCSPEYPVRGICPAGWHLPDTTEWKVLLDAAGGLSNGGEILKTTTGWDNYGNSNDGSGKDELGFSSVPTGYRYADGRYSGESNYANYWISTDADDGINAYRVNLTRGNNTVFMDAGFSKLYGFSVRCLKD